MEDMEQKYASLAHCQQMQKQYSTSSQFVMAGCAVTHHQTFVFCGLSKCKFIITPVQGLDFPV